MAHLSRRVDCLLMCVWLQLGWWWRRWWRRRRQSGCLCLLHPYLLYPLLLELLLYLLVAVAERVLSVVAEVELYGLVYAQLYEVVLGADSAFGLVHSDALHVHPQRLPQSVPVGHYDDVRAALEAVLHALLHQLLHVVVGYPSLVLRQPLPPLLLTHLRDGSRVGSRVGGLCASDQARVGDVLEQSGTEGVDAFVSDLALLALLRILRSLDCLRLIDGSGS